MADNGLLIGVDFGTGSSKGVLVRPNGEMVASEALEHRTSNPRPGFFEHDAEDVWWHDFTTIVEALLAKADGPIVGVCTSGIGPCQLPADADGKPLRPAILYGVDTRAYKEVAELTDRYGDDTIVAAVRQLADLAVAGREVAVAGPQPAMDLREDPVLLHVAHLHGVPADRRVRAGPPVGIDVRTDVLAIGPRLDPGMVRGRRPRPAAAAPDVLQPGRRAHHRRGRTGDRPARGDPGRRRHHRRVLRGAQRRGEGSRPGHAHVRLDDRGRPDHRTRGPASGAVVAHRDLRGHVLPGRRPVGQWRADHLAARPPRWGRVRGPDRGGQEVRPARTACWRCPTSPGSGPRSATRMPAASLPD